MQSEFGFGRSLQKPFDEVVGRVTACLADEGFGILSDIDVAAKMRDKLDIDMPRYRIPGARNHGLAHKAIVAVKERNQPVLCEEP